MRRSGSLVGIFLLLPYALYALLGCYVEWAALGLAPATVQIHTYWLMMALLQIMALAIAAGLRLVQEFQDSAAKRDELVHSLTHKTVGSDGLWGPVQVPASAPVEFEIRAAGYATTHLYRSGFPRSSQIIHLRPERLTDADKGAEAVVSLVRPRGYFDPARDTLRLDGTVPPGIPPGAGVASSRIRPQGVDRPVQAEFNAEKIVGRTWPASDAHLTVLEITQ